MNDVSAISNDRPIGEAKLVTELRELWLSKGEPSYRELSKLSRRSPSTINDVITARRIASWEVVRDVVEALQGDVDHFQKLYQLVRSERLELEERADELSANLNMPVSRTQTDASTHVVSHGGSVIIQSGTVASYNPLVSFVPPEIMSTYEAACLAYASGAYAAVLTMARSLVEAVVVRQTDGDRPVQGLAALADAGVITSQIAEQGEALWRAASGALHGQTIPHVRDASDALGYVLALLSCVYVINRGQAIAGP